ncbi:MAG: hypothetical protein P8J20_11190 [Novosphingobium sp.]|nr:hypothetical protein [Novosphingobium sp.]
MQASLTTAMAAILAATVSFAASAETEPSANSLTVETLSAERQLRLRCTMLAGVIVDEHERGVRDDALGLDQDIIERLGENLAGLLSSEYGADDGTTHDLLKSEFERFSATAATDPEATKSEFDELTLSCEPVWFGPPPLPTAPHYAGKQVDANLCFALHGAFAEAISARQGGDTDISKVFARRANRIEAALLDKAGDDDAARECVVEKLRTAAANLDVVAFDALDEPHAETIMTWCERLAGPDE